MGKCEDEMRYEYCEQAWTLLKDAAWTIQLL